MSAPITEEHTCKPRRRLTISHPVSAISPTGKTASRIAVSTSFSVITHFGKGGRGRGGHQASRGGGRQATQAEAAEPAQAATAATAARAGATAATCAWAAEAEGATQASFATGGEAVLQAETAEIGALFECGDAPDLRNFLENIPHGFSYGNIDQFALLRISKSYRSGMEAQVRILTCMRRKADRPSEGVRSYAVATKCDSQTAWHV